MTLSSSSRFDNDNKDKEDKDNDTTDPNPAMRPSLFDPFFNDMSVPVSLSSSKPFYKRSSGNSICSSSQVASAPAPASASVLVAS